MRFISFFFLATLLNQYILAQSPYFQQEVTNIINVELDDVNHTLNANIKIQYTNRSPDLLDKIAIHIWPNAYSTKLSKFTKQKLLARNTRFYDAKVSEMGNISDLKFTVNKNPAAFTYHKNNPDIIWLQLLQPLKPNETVEIETPFKVKIPASFSRLGHVDQTYQITQWFPKPAVYDHKGWHPMPYLDQGEFYSEFGSYDVYITLPANYVVGATGLLMTHAELEFINQRISQTDEAITSNKELFNTMPLSQTDKKTLHYHAENVHDFAWFADKSFYIQKSEAKLHNGNKIDTWAMFTKLGHWNKAVDYVSRSVEFYSEHVGAYPWPQATAVHSALSAGGGMEYPMITVIGDANTAESLDEVITHEVGHNWFYGILASNERDHPYMDEGINSYYENRYMKKYYHNEDRFIPAKFRKWIGDISEKEMSYNLYARTYEDQYPDQHSSNFTSINYGTDVYMKSAHLFEYAEKVLGTTKFDACMQEYFNKWKFKHPYPEDLQAIFKSRTGNETDWLFNQALITNNKADYAFQKFNSKKDRKEVIIKNKGKIAAPFTVTGIKDNQVIFQSWIPGFTGHKSIPYPSNPLDKLIIDREELSYDLYRNNNVIRTHGLFKKMEPIRLSLTPLMDDPYKNEIGILPLVGWNSYDKFMIGTYITPPLFPNRKFYLKLAPMYAFGSKKLVGFTDAKYSWFFPNNKNIHDLSIFLHTKKFSYFESPLDKELLDYHQYTPSLKINFVHKPSTSISSSLEYKYHYITDHVFEYRDSLKNIGHHNNQIHQLFYLYANPYILSPYSVHTGFQVQQYKDFSGKSQMYIRADFEYKRSYRYMPKRYIDFRFFGSMFPYNSERESPSIGTRSDYAFTQGSVGLAYQGYLDITNENFFFGRTRPNGIWSQQIDLKQGGFKLAPGISQANNLGNTNILLAAVNLSSDLPFKFIGKRIRPYLDLGYYEPQKINANAEKILISGGLNLRIFNENINIYFPIYHSKNIKDLYRSLDNYKYTKEITFNFSFKIPTLQKVINTISF